MHTLAATVGRGSPVRVVVWVLHVAGPMLGLWLLVARPELDLRWGHHGAHFGLVLGSAAFSVSLGALMGRAARRHGDARLFLVSLVFLVSAGFLGVHALATPGVLVSGANAGFVLATPVGLVLGGALAVASSVEFSQSGTARLLRWQRALAVAPWALLGIWAALSLAELPPLDRPPDPVRADGALLVLAIVGGVLYLLAALRYLRIYRRRPAVVLLSVLTAFVLLAEALFALAVARSWRMSWWEWHVLMALAFCFIAYSAHVQFRREGSARGLFDSVTLAQTVAALRHDYTAALEAMVDAVRRRGEGDARPLGPVTARLAERFDLTEQQVAVLERSAEALGQEREQVRRLGALVAVGRQASVIRREDDLLTTVMSQVRGAFPGDELGLGLVRSGELLFADGGSRSPALATESVATLEAVLSADGATLLLPLTVKGRAAGVLEAHRPRGPLGEAEQALLRSFASQLSIALENARLYHQLDGLFRSYMSPAVATALIADPEQAGLGGGIVEVSVLMADLSGFTPFAERTSPELVVAMLNTYYGAVVPVILSEGGTVVQFVGDAIMSIFNAPTRQRDHALRAARTGLRLHRAVEGVAAGHADWPRFRVGVNTGAALVGNVGAEQMRNFTAIGDTTNLAARLEGLAQPGQVVIGPLTYQQIRDRARVTDRGSAPVKGKEDPVPVYVLHGLDDPAGAGSSYPETPKTWMAGEGT